MSMQGAANSNRAPSSFAALVSGLDGVLEAIFTRIPHWLLAFLARFSVAAVFWKSGQTKVQNFQIDIVSGTFDLGLPKLADNTLFLFQEEYKLPFIAPELAAILATIAEHVFPFLLLIGLMTRASAFALLVMTLVIQVFVYPSAYPTHGLWAVALIYLMRQGGGAISLDAFFRRKKMP